MKKVLSVEQAEGRGARVRKEGEGTCARAVKRKKTYKDNNDNVNMSAYLFLNKHSYRYIDR